MMPPAAPPQAPNQPPLSSQAGGSDEQVAPHPGDDLLYQMTILSRALPEILTVAPAKGLALQKQLQEARAQLVKTQKDHIDGMDKALTIGAQVLGSVNDQRSYDFARRMIGNISPDIAGNMPSRYDPQVVQHLIGAGTSMQELNKRKHDAFTELLDLSKFQAGQPEHMQQAMKALGQYLSGTQSDAEWQTALKSAPALGIPDGVVKAFPQSFSPAARAQAEQLAMNPKERAEAAEALARANTRDTGAELEAKYQALQAKMNRGETLTPAEMADKKAFEQRKLLVPSATINLRQTAAGDKLIKVEHKDPATGRTVIEWLPQSQVAGQTFEKGVGATVESRLASATAVAQTGNDIIAQLSDPAVAAKVGPAMGRYNSLREFIGNPPPELSEIAGSIESYALANMGVHGMRSAQGAEQIKKLLDTKHTPASLIATIRGLNKFSAHFMENEGRPAAATSTSEGVKIGGFTVREKK